MSYGPAKFESTTARLDAKTRRAVSSSISALTYQIIHQNVGNDVLYHRANRDGDKMTGLYLNTVYSAEVLARRHMPWFEGGGGVWRTTILLFTSHTKNLTLVRAQLG